MDNGHSADPNAIYQKLPDGNTPIDLFISPSQYIQGHGVSGLLGEYLSLAVPGRRAGVLITPGRDAVLGAAVRESLEGSGFAMEKIIFQGESTLTEAERVVSFFKGIDTGIDILVGMGGGKCLDTARMAASRLQCPVVTVPYS